MLSVFTSGHCTSCISSKLSITTNYLQIVVSLFKVLLLMGTACALCGGQGSNNDMMINTKHHILETHIVGDVSINVRVLTGSTTRPPTPQPTIRSPIRQRTPQPKPRPTTHPSTSRPSSRSPTPQPTPQPVPQPTQP